MPKIELVNGQVKINLTISLDANSNSAMIDVSVDSGEQTANDSGTAIGNSFVDGDKVFVNGDLHSGYGVVSGDYSNGDVVVSFDGRKPIRYNGADIVADRIALVDKNDDSDDDDSAQDLPEVGDMVKVRGRTFQGGGEVIDVFTEAGDHRKEKPDQPYPQVRVCCQDGKTRHYNGDDLAARKVTVA